MFGPADFMASLGMRSLQVGAQPAGYVGGDAYHYPRMRILVAARSRGLAAIDGPYLAIRDTDGLRQDAASVAALGYDGKWVLHPGPGGRGQRGLRAGPGELRPGRADPGRVRRMPPRSSSAAR